MATKRPRQTTIKDAKFDPYINLIIDIIIDAIIMVNGQSVATELQKSNALKFLQSDKCQRWSLMAGVDFRGCIDKKNSKVKI